MSRTTMTWRSRMPKGVGYGGKKMDGKKMDDMKKGGKKMGGKKRGM